MPYWGIPMFIFIISFGATLWWLRDIQSTAKMGFILIAAVIVGLLVTMFMTGVAIVTAVHDWKIIFAFICDITAAAGITTFVRSLNMWGDLSLTLILTLLAMLIAIVIEIMLFISLGRTPTSR